MSEGSSFFLGSYIVVKTQGDCILIYLIKGLDDVWDLWGGVESNRRVVMQ